MKKKTYNKNYNIAKYHNKGICPTRFNLIKLL